jgi:polyisoprenyl-phosphate glycosyltransferase
VPVYNSQDCLAELSQRIGKVFDQMGAEYELILVNDCSTDASWQKILAIAGANPSIKGLSFRKNFGQDNALMAGLRPAQGDYIIIMDDDLQHDPAYIPALAKEISTGFDVVYASYSVKKQSMWKNMGSWFNGKVAQIVLGKPANVYLSPFKIIRKGVVQEICKYEGAYPYVDGLLFRVTSSFSQVKVEHRERYKGSGGYTFLKSLRVWSYLATNFSIFPLRLATVLGLFSAFGGAVLGIFFLAQRLLDPTVPSGWASLIVSVLSLGGIQLFSVGILGEYIGRAYLTINRQPQYVIKETTEL